MTIATILLLIITALGLASAVAIAQLRDAGIGRRLPATPADPSDLPFVAASAGALRRNAGGGRSVLLGISRRPHLLSQEHAP